jgi:Exoribonuclease R
MEGATAESRFSVSLSSSFVLPVSCNGLTIPFGKAVKSTRASGVLYMGKLETRGVKHARGNKQSQSFVDIVRKGNIDSRMMKIHARDLPRVAEIHAQGAWRLCIITAFKTPNAMKGQVVESGIESIVPPLLEVLIIEPDIDGKQLSSMDKAWLTIDIGQITSVWDYPIEKSIDHYAKFLLNELVDARLSLQRDFSVTRGENIMQSIYEQKARPLSNRSQQKSLSNKDIARIADTFPQEISKNHVQQLLKKAIKGSFVNSSNRFVDSVLVASELYSENVLDNVDGSQRTKRLLAGASLLALDAELGGRFKRNPSIFISAEYESQDEIVSVTQINLLSGGWIPVDQSVRAGTEARKFVTRNTADSKIFTAADERIMHRLECLALGELLGARFDSRDLELDVRETLTALGLDLTPEGAQQALVRVGKWSPLKKDEIQEGQKGIYQNYSPWSEDLLTCAKEFRDKVKERCDLLLSQCSTTRNANAMIEGRVNLTSLPAVSIDAKRTTFRDDAIGLRRRSVTGRKVEKGSKWELLIHIADVSDIYSPNPISKLDLDVSCLKKAAEIRGMSRYDLPLGPLHLMPPVALEALALSVNRGAQARSVGNSVNRCVTLSVYIDENDGRVIDAGLERSLIGKPRALTFDEASKILSNNDSNQMKMFLSSVEKVLSAWKTSHLERNEAARKREKRMTVREIVAKDTLDGKQMRDDGAKGSFQRTRGHKMVDNTLDLHGYVLRMLLKRNQVPVPQASGSGADRGGRLGTAPLRRYIDGVVQRQALSALCNYGGPPLTRQECNEVNKVATDTINKVNNLKSSKKASEFAAVDNEIRTRKKSLRALASHFACNNVRDSERIVPALSTGYNNKVVLSGLGIVVQCKGVKGTLKTGQRLLVRVTKLDEKVGAIEVEFSSFQE